MKYRRPHIPAMVPLRPAAVAGMFYPAAPRELAWEVDNLLGHSAGGDFAPGFPKALIVPHAGYVYSGGIAAEAYDRLRPARGIVRRVVLLGPCHRVPAVSYTHLRAHETDSYLVCRLLLEKKK